MSISFDMSQVRSLSQDLGKFAAGKFDDVDNALHDAAFLATEVAKDRAAGTRWRRVGRSWTFERASSVGEIAYEAGPDKSKDRAAGLLGAYLGWPNGGGGSLDIDAPLKAVEGPLLKALGEALDRVL